MQRLTLDFDTPRNKPGDLADSFNRRLFGAACRLLALAVLAIAATTPAGAQTEDMTEDGAILYDEMSPIPQEISPVPQGMDGEYGEYLVDGDGMIVEGYAPVAGDCGGCGHCSACLRHGGWFQTEYLSWWDDPVHLPALATSDPDDGILPGANLLLGREDVADDARSGVRFDFGFWIDHSRTLGVGASYYSLEGAEFYQTLSADGTPILARPFIDGDTLARSASALAEDGEFEGSLAVGATSDFYGGDVYFRGLIEEGPCGWLDYMVGWQYASLDDLFYTNATIDFIGAGFPAGQQSVIRDKFVTENDYNGFTVGLLRQRDLSVWGVRLLTKLGFGNMRQRVRISGSTVTTVPGSPTVSDGDGFLTADSNQGSFERDRFVVVPELGLTLTRQLNCNTDLTFGYSLIYYSSVVRATDQIDTINDQPVIGGPHPDFEFHSDDYLLQGINVGLLFRR